MTNQEALKFIRERVDFIEEHYPEMEEYHDALVMAIAALEQQNPIEPYGKEFIYDFQQAGTCPRCGIRVTDSSKFCYKCGQALDWKEGD